MTVIKEEVDITPYVERGLVGVNVDAVRDNINTFLNGSLGKCFITPYVGLERTRKVLANFHIFLPRTTFLEGDRGVEVFDIKQFGEAMGMRNDGTVVTKVSDPYSLYFEYKMNEKGMFDVFAEIVTKDELDDLLDAVEDDMDDDSEDDREEKLDESEISPTRLSPEEMKKMHDEYNKNRKKPKSNISAIAKLFGAPKLDESSESVNMSGPETGSRRITGQPDYGMAPDYEDTCEANSELSKGEQKKDDVISKSVLNARKKSRLAEGEVIRFSKAKANVTKKPGEKRDPKALLRTPERNKEIESKRPKNWTDEVTKKPSMLQKVTDYIKKKV